MKSIALRPRPARSLAHALVRGTRAAVVLTATLALCYTLAGGGGAKLVSPEAPAAPNAVEAVDLTEGHDCTIEDTIPTGAIIRYRGRDAIYTTNPKRVDAAFDFAIATMFGETPKDRRIEGVTLCLDKPVAS